MKKAVLSLIFAANVAGGCDGGGTEPRAPAPAVHVAPDSVRLRVGERLAVEVSSQNVDSGSVIVRVLDESVARYGHGDTIVAVGVGSTWLLAGLNDARALDSMFIAVDPKPGIRFAEDSLRFQVGQVVEFSLTLEHLDSEDVELRVAEPRIAALYSDSTIAGLQAGRTWLMAESHTASVRDSMQVIVAATIPGCLMRTISPTQATMRAGETLRIDVGPAECWSTGVVFRSGNETVATVDSTGLVTARSPGSTTVTAASRTDPNDNVVATVTVVH